ncbi:MAG TPA: bifunctional (p)ppGpp synthetase/guanosine-3',5'-bis(diphosphate) 3'-pyrophosphohydrolase [Peptococcaceae bacterium]|nr:bifunctional (p)ppGpp synthetase/guanosine-3',5'-bis(diphosphate) 3'-pyrophosphohydrolase [Peptococcaceae bacterium]HPZ70741.1 bifunctional (p)ppGpp synthetase/guanosine-3',5'-bis(diphosphate) 3'-pyrophosphohydrolase [Peptococcaceae bacterium]HQD54399.1 bifunctional (p)ppGpp synthetase/guanosine-3',5'-bis(diphosphate) 3'-pyrophosphohydrolase [Peptococcaceae bacterium]
MESIKNYMKAQEIALVEKAYHYAQKAHEGQVRNSGEPYIIHPLAVAQILASLELDAPTLVAGLLHDVVEDTPITLEEIEKHFGPEIALVVDGVTKLNKIDFRSQEEQQVENLRKMFLAMAKDIRVIMIKLADRLHNMRTLKHQPEHKQREIAQETLEIFAPLANRLGIFSIKWELEDTAFHYLNAEEYYNLVEKISMKRHEREAYIERVIKILKEKVVEANIRADIEGRPKHFYSIYQKMKEQGKELNEIYDLIAVRVIVDTVKDCYEVLGIVHTLWKPIPGRFKDYIAMPKPNMYQSLHTTVMGFLGEPFEIQIRTVEMHKTAQFGIAAHWKYKEGNKAGSKDMDERLAWLRKILEWQTELRDTKEFMEALKIDVYSDVVFVFTPKGDVIELPAGSLPIDFAYRIHSDIGNSCVGAKVNGKIVPLDYVLKNGDIVEILTSKQSNGPSRDWLLIVKTPQAKNRIRTWFRKEKREENIRLGRESLEKELKRQGLDPAELFKTERLLETAKKFSLNHFDDLFAAVGEGTITPYQIITRVRDEYYKDVKKEIAEVPLTEIQKELQKGKRNKTRHGAHGIIVKGVDGVFVRLSHCCNPLPGDAVIGYITRGRGVSIHRTDCPNVQAFLKEDRGRIVEVTWKQGKESVYQVELEVYAIDRARLTMEIMNAIADMKLQINAVNARISKNKLTIINLRLEIHSIAQLNHLIEKIKRIKNVTEVNRVIPKR